METEIQKTKNRLVLLENMLNSSLREIEYLKISLYAKLDDWIIYGLKNENDAIN
mgnify:CR=1 FL=1